MWSGLVYHPKLRVQYCPCLVTVFVCRWYVCICSSLGSYFLACTGGVYNPFGCCSVLNHAVLIVGYGALTFNDCAFLHALVSLYIYLHLQQSLPCHTLYDPLQMHSLGWTMIVLYAAHVRSRRRDRSRLLDRPE